MNKPLISVIVPVYNVEKYLNKCIDSLLSQTYGNIEIILVDDGSKDSSGQICDMLVEKHNNIKVVHKQNAGLGFARNSGLDVASGEYVTFVDSDDWVSSKFIEHLYKGIINNEVDFCKSGFQRVLNNGDIVSITRYNNELYKGNQAATKLLPRMIGSAPDKHDSLEMCVCGVLYKLSIIKEQNVRFPSERELICEDLVFNIDYLQYANGACSIDYLDYYYRMNAASLTHTYRPDRHEACVFFYKEIKKKLIDLEYGKSTLDRLGRMFFIHMRMIINQEKKKVSKHSSKQSIKNIYKLCEDETVRNVIKEYPINKLGIKQRLFIKLIYYKCAAVLYAFSNLGFI